MNSETDPPGHERPESSGADEPLVRRVDEEPVSDGERSTVGPAESDAPDASAQPRGASLPELPEYESPASIRSRDRQDSHRQDTHRQDTRNMLPGRVRRRFGVERLLVRLIATCGIVGIGVAIAAIMVSNKSQGWVVGLVVSIVSVGLAAVLWSSRQL
jgi:hypothetical protein